MNLQKYLKVSDAPHVGTITWWSIREVLVPYDHIVELCKRVGLETDWVPQPYASDAAFSAAWRAVKGRLGRKPLYDIREYPESRGHRVDVLRVERDSSAKILRAQSVCSVELDTDKVYVLEFEEDDNALSLGSDIAKLYETYLENIDSDRLRFAITQFITKDLRGCQLRPTGGVYWVPSSSYSSLTMLQWVLGQLGCRLETVEVFDVAGTLESLRNASRLSLESQLQELEETMSRLARATTPGLASRLQEVISLRERALLYRDCLQTKIDDIEQRLQEFESTIIAAFKS